MPWPVFGLNPFLSLMSPRSIQFAAHNCYHFSLVRIGICVNWWEGRSRSRQIFLSSSCNWCILPIVTYVSYLQHRSVRPSLSPVWNLILGILSATYQHLFDKRNKPSSLSSLLTSFPSFIQRVGGLCLYP